MASTGLVTMTLTGKANLCGLMEPVVTMRTGLEVSPAILGAILAQEKIVLNFLDLASKACGMTTHAM